MTPSLVLALAGLFIIAAGLLIWGCGADGLHSPYSKRMVPGAGTVAPAAPAIPLGEMGYSPDEELWIIERPRAEEETDREDRPGTGSLLAKRPGATRPVPVPLEHTAVAASISGYIATVEVRQRFVNPFSEKIEAIYVFPLPHNAAVTEFLMTIGERKIRGIIREREEAEQIYYAARRQGYVAALMTQERPNIFTQSVANIEPGRRIDVDIRYFHTLAFVKNEYEFVFPMVVGPRFNPPGSADGVGAGRRENPGATGQPTEVAYLGPNERSGHDISLEVAIDAGVPIERVTCPSHTVRMERISPSRTTVRLSANDAVLNRDFVLRYSVGAERMSAGLLTHRDQRGGFFTLMLYPPADLEGLAPQPMELIFLMDCSGSMEGLPLEKAKAAASRALKRLGPGDAFQVIRFSDSATRVHRTLIPATAANVGRGLRDLERLECGGGTMMTKGIRAALRTRQKSGRFRVVTLMTDGYIGNEAEVLEVMRRDLGSARIFSFGVGSSVNRYLMESMARLGRGAVAYVGLDESSGRAVDRFYERVRHPALTDVSVDWGSLRVTEVYPRRIPDLFVGRPVIVTGRFEGEVPPFVVVQGRAAGEIVRTRIPIQPAGTGEGHPGLPYVWARKKISELHDAAIVAGDDSEFVGPIRKLALQYGLLSAHTAFVAVDSETRTTGDHGVSVLVPVPVPQGVRYDTTVGR